MSQIFKVCVIKCVGLNILSNSYFYNLNKVHKEHFKEWGTRLSGY